MNLSSKLPTDFLFSCLQWFNTAETTDAVELLNVLKFRADHAYRCKQYDKANEVYQSCLGTDMGTVHSSFTDKSFTDLCHPKGKASNTHSLQTLFICLSKVVNCYHELSFHLSVGQFLAFKTFPLLFPDILPAGNMSMWRDILEGKARCHLAQLRPDTALQLALQIVRKFC